MSVRIDELAAKSSCESPELWNWNQLRDLAVINTDQAGIPLVGTAGQFRDWQALSAGLLDERFGLRFNPFRIRLIGRRR